MSGKSMSSGSSPAPRVPLDAINLSRFRIPMPKTLCPLGDRNGFPSGPRPASAIPVAQTSSPGGRAVVDLNETLGNRGGTVSPSRLSQQPHLSGDFSSALQRRLFTGAIAGLDIRSETRPMRTRFSEDVVPLTDLKVNPGRVGKQASRTHRPVLLTSRGRAVAVVQSVADYEATEEERDFMRAVVAGLEDFEAGRELPLADAKSRLGLD